MTETIDGADADLVEMTVLAGRTISVANPWKHVKQLVTTPEGTATTYVKVPVPGAKTDYGPGETVYLPRDEAARLEALGYVAPPGKAINTRPIATMINAEPDRDAPPGKVSTVTR